MMAREEAIALLNEQYETCKRIYDCSADQRKSYPNVPQFMEALGMALSALRPVSRERVERMFPGCKMCSGWNTIKLKPCVNGDLGVQADIGSAGKGDTFGLVVYSHLLASGYVDFPFCPFCGKPKTDEAVEMVVERLEGTKDD